jgi:ABC-type transport system involved in multi-copper enzyme maturation permease subunit
MLKSIRFEFVSLTLILVVLAAGALAVAWRLDQIDFPPACLYGMDGSVAEPDPGLEAICAAKQDAFSDVDGKGSLVLAFAAFIPVIAGLLLGVPLIGRELESGTASLAWTLSRSRRSWYLRRAIPLSLIVGLILVLPAITTQVMEAARQPGIDPWASFNNGSLRGPVLVLRGWMTLGLGVLVGAVLGRQLPGIIVAGLVTIVVLGLIPIGIQNHAQTVAEWLPAAQSRGNADQTFDYGYRDRQTGEILSFDAAYARAPVIPDVGPDDAWIASHLEEVRLAVPGRRYPEFVVLECAALGLVALVALGLGGLVVSRRRPA